jgi:hypothetical protein
MKDHLRIDCRFIVDDFPRANSCIYLSIKVTKRPMSNASIKKFSLIQNT